MKYSIGLDIGISSVGWAVINEDLQRIERMNVRVFDAAENPKNGSSLAAPRREARSARKRLRRRRHRLGRVRQLMVQLGLLTKVQLDQLYDWRDGDLDIWLLRVNAFERKLTDREFARILIHLAKYRGFKSNRKSDTVTSEQGVVLSAVQENALLMEEKGYRTVAEMLLMDEKFEGRKRNKEGEYSHVLARSELEQEIRFIFEKQREFTHPFAHQDNEAAYLKIWAAQRPFATKDDIMKKIGMCSLEPKEQRAPKFSYTFERFRAVDKLNRLRILADHAPQRSLTDEEREVVLNALFGKIELKYKDVRTLLALAETERFNELYYDQSQTMEKNEAVTFLSVEGQYKLRKAVDDALGKGQADKFRPADLDTFAYALTVFKDDQDIRDYLRNEYVDERGKQVPNLVNQLFEDEVIEALLTLSFAKFAHLSLKALHNILPYMEQGQSYTDACKNAGYVRSKETKREKLLPVIPTEDIANPVVIRSLAQTRKIINGIIKRYGSPSAIYIELAREMGRDYKERRELEKQYNRNRGINEQAKKHIHELYPAVGAPRGHDILKYKFWQEQSGYCAYSINKIPADRLLEPGYVEVDHVIPYSRSFDDSNANKVLVLKSVNQNKLNRTPFEWFGHDQERWQQFQSFVTTLKINKKKKDHLLKKNYGEEQATEFKARHLNDTRYITRFLKTFIEEKLQFREEEGRKQYVFTVNGAYTSLMRKRWGFNKNRAENDLHHALDAVIVAVSWPFQHQVSAYFKRREEQTPQLLKREEERFPEPWSGFIKEVEARMLQHPEQLKLALESLDLASYDQDFINEVQPIFVSRMPKRSVKGQIHEATLRRKRGFADNGMIKVVTKTKLEDIPFKETGDFPMFGKESDPKTYKTIKQRFLEHDKDLKQAFSKPLYKPSKNMDTAPIIRTIKIEEVRKQVVELDEHTVADNASIVRTEVFRHKKNGKFYLAPVYVADVLASRVPKKFITANQPYQKWDAIPENYTEEYDYLFALYPNDLIKVRMPRPKVSTKQTKDKITWQESFFYFKGVDSGTASISIIDHMNSFSDRIGSKTLELLEKYQVDPLGNITKVHGEKRHGL